MAGTADRSGWDGMDVDWRAAGAYACALVEELARFSDAPDALTRLYLSPAHRAAADHLLVRMRELGMAARIDAAGSVQGRWEGERPDAPALLIGSHIDTVIDAGRWDGNLGVACGLALVAALRETGRHLPFAVEVVAFGDEENVRFPTEISTARALAGRYDPAWLDAADAQGIPLRDALVAFGGDPDGIAALARRREDLVGYLEVHIEQGPVLEQLDRPVGLVEAIVGIARGQVTVTGFAGHAGTVPMAMRRDALAAAAEMVGAVEAAGSTRNRAVATVGRLQAAPGAPNVIAGKAEFTLDIRSPDAATRTDLAQAIAAAIEAIAARRGVEAAIRWTALTEPTPMDEGLRATLARAGAACGLDLPALVSGAGHDAMAMAGLCPSAMLFVRCKDGISHNPAEAVAPGDVAAAMRVLLAAVADLAARHAA